MTEFHETRIDIPEGARLKLVDLLNRQLADTTDLFTQVKYAHWNVKGSDFIQLHLLFDDIATHVLEFSDLIAERPHLECLEEKADPDSQVDHSCEQCAFVKSHLSTLMFPAATSSSSVSVTVAESNPSLV
jgi:hypothetical protein